jgi:beta-lactamase regulating signal transducer with metallopeptidase domain
MLTNQFNTYLYAIGNGMLHSIWIAALLLLAYLAITRIWNLSAGNKFKLAVVANGIVLLSFFIAIFTGSATYQDVWALPMAAQTWLQTALQVVRIQLIPVLAAAYCIVSVGMLLRLAMGWHSITNIRQQNLLKPSVDIRLFVQEKAQWLHIQQPVKVWLSNRISSPMTVGFLKPVILLPVAIVNQLTPAQVEAILIHELAHIKRYDYLINIGLQIADSFLFFNPFAKQLLKIAYAEREYSCDDWVLQFNYDKQLYAQALLNIGKAALQPVMAMGLANKKHGSLYQRICRLAGIQTVGGIAYSQYIGRSISLLLVIAIISIATVENRQLTKMNSEQAAQNDQAAIELKYVQMAFDWMFGNKPAPLKNTAAKPLSENTDKVEEHAIFAAIAENPEGPANVPMFAIANNNHEEIVSEMLPDLPADMVNASQQIAELEALGAALAHREAMLQHEIAKEHALQQQLQAKAAQQELAQLNKWKQWLKTVLLENKHSIEAVEQAKVLEQHLAAASLKQATYPTFKQKEAYTVFETPELSVTFDANEDLIIAPKKSLVKPVAPVMKMDSMQHKPAKTSRIIAL